MLQDIPTLYNIPAGLPFSDCLATGIMQQYGDKPELFAKMTIFLPSKRGIRTLRDSFLKINYGKILLLPKIRSLGDALDDEMSLLPDDEASPYAVLTQKRPISNGIRQLALTRLILDTIKPLKNNDISYPEAFSLAATLIELMDSLQSERISVDDLKTLDVGDYAENWQKNLEIASIVTELWPQYLANHGYSDPVAYRNIILAYLTDFWEKNPPNNPVIVAGSTGSMPASADFMKLIGRLPNGCVVLPGLDTHLTAKDIAELRADHPQYGLYKLINHFGNAVDTIKNWYSTEKFLTNRHVQRQKLCHEVMRPSGTAEAWFNVTERLSHDDIITAIDDLNIIHAPNDRKEASAIALIIREALETPYKNVALITPNRILVQRVTAMLSRWHLKPNDSAGIPLSDLPQGVYFKLLCDVLEQNFSPIPLLAFLKHPFSNAGLAKGQFKTQVRRFEYQIFRGTAPKNGLAGYRQALEVKIKTRTDNSDYDSEKLEYYHLSLGLIDYLEKLFAPILALPDTTTMADFINSFKTLVAEFTCTDTQTAAEIFWSNDAGRSGDDLLSSFIESSELLGTMSKQAIYGHIKEFSAKIAVRPAFGYNKNIVIWGTPEARLQQADIVILAGLTEGSWPIAPDTGVWLSRPMRQQLGLTPPERRIGLSSHDFVQAVCGTKVFLTHSAESNGSPNIPSRWLIRLENLLKGAFKNQDMMQKLHDSPYLSWVDMLDDTEVKPKPANRPAPKPPLEIRPKSMSVTDAEKWIRDPYAIYGKYILNLKKLSKIDEDFDNAERGTLIHDLLHDFTIETQHGFLGKPHDIMRDLLDKTIETLRDRPLLYTFWGNRFRYIGMQFVDFEIERRKSLKPILSEHDGHLRFATSQFATSQGDFTLKARCDRIDLTSGGDAIIVDYKTSSAAAHSYEQMKAGFAPQLPLQAVMLRHGGFGKAYPISGAEYIVIADTKNPAFEIKAMKAKKDTDNTEPLFADLSDDIFDQFKDWVEKFNDIDTAYTSRRLPEFLKYEGDYDLLARVKEWGLSDDGGDDGGDDSDEAVNDA